MSIPFVASPDVFAVVGRDLDALSARLADALTVTGSDLDTITMPRGWTATEVAGSVIGEATRTLTETQVALSQTVAALYAVAAGYHGADLRSSRRQDSR
jgi:hypothetical protein